MSAADEPGGFDPEQLELDARETLNVAWAEVLGADDPLAADAEDRAVELLLAEGVAGLPGLFLAFYVHPYAALAAALDEHDPRAGRLRDAIDDEPRMELQWEGRSYRHDEGLARTHRQCRRQLRAQRVLPVVYRRRSRVRSSRQRRVRAGSTGCRSPDRPSDPDHDPPSDGLLARLVARARRRGRRRT